MKSVPAAAKQSGEKQELQLPSVFEFPSSIVLCSLKKIWSVTSVEVEPGDKGGENTDAAVSRNE